MGTVVAGLLVLAGTNVAVLCASPETQGGSCGPIQVKVETELSDAGFAVKPAHEYGKDWTAPEAKKDGENAKTALDEAVKAFYEGRLDAAKQKLDQAAQLYATAKNPVVADVVKLHLWRVTVSLATNEPPGNALLHLSEALTLDPGLTVDTAVFSSALKDYVDSVKGASGLPEETLTLDVRTPNAKVRIDDRDLASAKIPKGKHYLTATAPGHRPFTRVFNTKTDGTSYVIALAPAVEGALARAVQGARGETERGALRAFATTNHLDALVLVAPRGGESRVTVLFAERPGAEQSGNVRSDALVIASFAIDALKKGSAPIARATPVPVRTPPVHRGDPEERPFAFVVDGGLAVTSWSRAFDTTAAGYEKPVVMGGVGPRVVAGIVHASGAFAQVDASYVTYALFSTVESTWSSTEPTARKSAKGGAALHADASAGYRFVYLEDPAVPGYLGLSGGYVFEDYAAQVVKSDTGLVMPMFQSHTRSGPAVRVEAGHPVGPVHLRAGLGAWIASYEETPDGTNGATVSGNGTVPMWLLAASWKAPDRGLQIGVEYRGQMRKVSYEGASAPVVAIDGAKLDELLHVVSASARMRF